MSPNHVGFALILLAALFLVGRWLRVRVRWIQKIFLPSSIIAGFLALLAGPQVLGRLGEAAGVGWLADGGVFTPEILEVWATLPSLLISVVFATLFLGASIPGPRRVARLAGPQLSVGLAFGSGQYVVGLLLVIAVLGPLFGISPMAGALIEIGFEGGHGTAAGMRPVMEELGFEEGADLALGMATIGLVGGIVIGIAVINWGVRTGRTKVLKGNVEQSVEEQKGLYRRDENIPAAMMTSRPASIEPLTLHVAVVGIAILIGYLILTALQWVEQALWADTVELLAFVPLFPLAMLGGVVVQLVMDWRGIGHLLDHQMMLRIQGLALDFLILAAIATLSLTAIAANWEVFLVLSVAGVVFCTGFLLLFVPKVIPDYWLERGIADFGQSMGVTATGLILMRIADPHDESPAMEAFGYKQLFFEPFFGGGLITAASVPLIYQFGPWPLLVVMSVLFVVALVGGMSYRKRLVAAGSADAVHARQA